jgi:hypothetical protein
VADGLLAAGLFTHLPHAMVGLDELARVTRSGGRLALFHPIGRAALAVRHGRALDPDDSRDATTSAVPLDRTGWALEASTPIPTGYLAWRRAQPVD